MDTPSAIGRLIEIALQEQGINANELSRRLKHKGHEISPRAIRFCLTGETELPRPYNLRAICEELGISTTVVGKAVLGYHVSTQDIRDSVIDSELLRYYQNLSTEKRKLVMEHARLLASQTERVSAPPRRH